ncbi:MAG TPA: glycosyltransferase family 4 protein [Pelobium sp.]
MLAAKPKLLIIGSVWPEPNSSAAGSRMMQLIEVFCQKNYQITFASATADSEFAVKLSDFGVKKAKIKLNHHSFDDFVEDLNPRVVLFDRFMTEEQYGWRVSESCPEALKILDTEDLHCLRAARQKAWKTNAVFKTEDLLNEEVAKREIASILRCDLSLIISTYEMELLRSTFKIDDSLLLYLPFMLDEVSEEEIKKLPKYEERAHFVSIGNFLHEPNWQSVLHIKTNIWPHIRERLPKAEVHIYGAYPSNKVFQLNSVKDGFLVKGRAENVAETMQKARVCLAPLLFGAGLKGKLIDAMRNGTPNATTSIGAEAMHQNLPWSGKIKNTPLEFADAAVQLYQSEKDWLIAQQNGFEIINQLYAKSVFTQKFNHKIAQLLVNLASHRNKNFYGAMLQHHTLSSTKFMAKWIEAKNN